MTDSLSFFTPEGRLSLINVDTIYFNWPFLYHHFNINVFVNFAPLNDVG